MASRVAVLVLSSLRSLRLCVILLVAAMPLVAGCDRSGLNLAPVSGVVTYQGAPVANAGVLFMPATGPFATGVTDAEGRFTLTTANHEGAIVGSHRVAITKNQTTATQIAGARFPRYETKYFLPERYASPATSELTANVIDDDNNFNFDLIGNVSGT